MKNNLKLIGIFTATVFLSACGSTMYEQAYWKTDSQKADWEIDSLVCEEKARAAQADSEKLAENQALTNSLQRDLSGSGSQGENISAIVGLLGALTRSSAHSTAKSDEFIECMKIKNWLAKTK